MRTKRWLTLLTLLISVCFVLVCFKYVEIESPVKYRFDSRLPGILWTWTNETLTTEERRIFITPTAAAAAGQHATKHVVEELGPCPETSPHLTGPFTVDLNLTLTLDTVKEENPDLQDGGRFKPRECVAAQKVAVIVPFRNRHHQIMYLLHYLHPFLQRQQVDYGFYLVNQHGEGTFNKARLMNAGFQEALKEYEYDCFIFHDVDIIPMDDHNLYRCYGQPRHLAVAVDKFDFNLGYNQLIGGAIAFSKAQFVKVNGFSNSFWGWGGEDDAMYKRLYYRGMTLSRPDKQVARYTMMKHERDLHNEPNPNNIKVLNNIRHTMDRDGLNSLEYRVVQTEKDRLYTFITVDIGTP